MFQAGEHGETTNTDESGTETLVERYRRCSTDELIGARAQMIALSRSASAQALQMTAVLDERKCWQGDGATDMVGWVAMSDSVLPATARSDVAIARALVDLPRIAGSATRGELSMDQLRPLCRIADAASDAEWAAKAQGVGPAELCRLAKRHVRVPNAAAAKAQGASSLRWWHEVGTDGVPTMLRLSGRLTPDAGELVTQALRARKRIVRA